MISEYELIVKNEAQIFLGIFGKEQRISDRR